MTASARPRRARKKKVSLIKPRLPLIYGETIAATGIDPEEPLVMYDFR